MKCVVNPESLPAAAGPYSQAVRSGNHVFVAGMVGMDRNRKLAPDAAGQTRRALENMAACLADLGGAMADVCSVTAWLEDIDRDFATYNTVYREFFPADPPARATVQAHLMGGALVEIAAVAVLDD
ncbi:MAG: RidA family protein [Chloroflexota bacterium]